MKLPFWASFLTLCGVMVLCALGGWQLYRLGWKAQLLADLDVLYAQDASANPLTSDDFKDVSLKDMIFHRGTITGHYLNEKSFLLAPRVLNKEVGAHLIVPFELSSAAKEIVLVNRGWIPNSIDLKEASKITEITGEVILVGMARAVPEKNMFTPVNAPDKGQWYSLDVAQAAQIYDLENVLSGVFYLEQQERADQKFPVAAALKIELANNHAQYAFFWFSLAVALIGVYITRFVWVPLKKS